MHYYYDFENTNVYSRRGIDPEAYWMSMQQGPRGNENPGMGPTAPAGPARINVPAGPAAPTGPTRITVPTGPAAPTAPTRITVPTGPAAPTGPTRINVPTAPAAPITPTAPAAPTAPTAPAAPSVSVTLPTIPEPEEIEIPSLVSSGTIATVIGNCMEGMIFVWLKNGDRFWMIPRSSSSSTVTGYIWNEESGWYEDEISFSDILSVTCVS